MTDDDEIDREVEVKKGVVGTQEGAQDRGHGRVPPPVEVPDINSRSTAAGDNFYEEGTLPVIIILPYLLE